MDYTTVERVKAEMHAKNVTSITPSTNVDQLVGMLITSASRAIDRKCTGTHENNAIDYFLSELVTGETLFGQIDNHGILVCYPRKPAVSSVSALSYRLSPLDSWTAVDASRIVADGMRVEAWLSDVATTRPRGYSTPGRAFVQITYNGGLAVDASSLPADLVEAATVLAVRYFKEAESGLTDSIGVAELTSLIYTKAWPVRVLDMLGPFVRRVGWRGLA